MDAAHHRPNRAQPTEPLTGTGTPPAAGVRTAGHRNVLGVCSGFGVVACWGQGARNSRGGGAAPGGGAPFPRRGAETKVPQCGHQRSAVSAFTGEHRL